MIPVNDNVWHHLGFIWNNTNGRWDVLIDGTPRAMRSSVNVGDVIRKGGTVMLGGFHGMISGVNIWDKALTGKEVEDFSKSRGDEEGLILRWFNALNTIVGNIQVVAPSNARSTSKRFR